MMVELLMGLDSLLKDSILALVLQVLEEIYSKNLVSLPFHPFMGEGFHPVKHSILDHSHPVQLVPSEEVRVVRIDVHIDHIRICLLDQGFDINVLLL